MDAAIPVAVNGGTMVASQQENMMKIQVNTDANIPVNKFYKRHVCVLTGTGSPAQG